ncbi:MAG TPA: diguanylate cyclase [Burkholderiaceae bacterium]|nr:diguanylate cyclase [Burkholderiaceae bacterium]HMY99548.1 diguanylate cyclase [Burkholderiaceae bacterium]HNB45110.1 diguanylate cyclase [Burkholderiaceae bacterium]HNG78595.1 diguanylate cyclase [Burkholderiaceae bacterium]
MSYAALAPLLDSLVRLAAKGCGATAALLRLESDGALVAQHAEGLDDAPAETAFLAHVARVDALIEIEDAPSDPRFAADPLVTGPPRARLLVGVPLFLPTGERAGALCVLDVEARRLDEVQADLLRRLAVAVSQSIALNASVQVPRPRPVIELALAPASSCESSSACAECASVLPAFQKDSVELETPEQVRQAVQRQTDILRLVTEAIPATVVVVGGDNRYHFVNSAFERYAGLPRDQILGRTAMDVLGEVEVARRRPWMKRALTGETVRFTLDYATPDGTQWLELTCIPLKMAGGEVDGFVGIGQDVTQQKLEQDRLTDLARRDPLTGLFNRLGFEQQIEYLVRQGRGGQLGLLYIDLDAFKPVNDTHGHAAGDRVLEQFAHRLKALVRPTDVVARLGGDEFAVLLVGLREAANAAVVAGKVVHAATAPFDTDVGPLHIGASVGAAFAVNPELGWRELIARADAQLYVAKAAGRSTFRGPLG